MGRSGRKVTRVPVGNLILICEVCGSPVVNGKGFLTIRDRKWLIYDESCAESENVVCGVLPGVSGNRLCKINVSMISTADLLLTTLATLAIELKSTNWLQLIQKVVWDTEFYFDPDGLDGGRRTVVELKTANREAYERAGIGQQMNMKGA